MSAGLVGGLPAEAAPAAAGTAVTLGGAAPKLSAGAGTGARGVEAAPGDMPNKGLACREN